MPGNNWKLNKSISAWLFIFIPAALYPLFLGRFPAVGDLRDVYIPLELFFQSGQLSGFLPAWNSSIAWGFPVIASAQIGFFYPLLLALRWLPISIYLPAILILHLLLAGFGAYRLFRVSGISAPGALIGALVFSLGGFFTLHLTHLNIFMAAAYLPWQLLFLNKLAVSPSRRPLYLALAILSLGLPLLVGQIQIPLLMMLFSLIYFIFQCQSRRLGFTSTFRLTAILLITAILLGAAQLLPTYELASLSSRANPDTFDVQRANQYSYPLYHLPATLFPFFYGNDHTYWGKRLQIEYGFYFGTIPFLLLLASAWLWFRARPPLSRPHKFWLAVLVTSFLLALGNLSPFRLIGLEPSLWYFSAPARWLLFASLAAAYFSAVSYDYFLRRLNLTRRYLRRLSIILLLLISAANIILFSPLPVIILNRLASGLSQFQIEKLTSLHNSALSSSLSLAAWPTWIVVIILLILSFNKYIPHRHISRFLILITGVELALIASLTTPYLPWSDILSPPNTINSLPASVRNNQSRLLTMTGGGDTGAYFTNPDSRANAQIRSLQKSSLTPLLHSQYQISGVAWPASLPLQEAAAILARVQDQYNNQDVTLAESYNIGAVINSTDNKFSVSLLNPAPRFAFSPDNGASEINISPEFSSSAKLVFNTNFDQPGTLIVRDTWYPGWLATLDNQPVNIDKFQTIFRRVSLPAGPHTINLFYQPIMLYSGLIITIITSAILLLLLIYSFIHRPSTNS